MPQTNGLVVPQAGDCARPRVLVVEDQIDLGRALVRLISRQMDVTLALNCADALAASKQQRFDLFLLDIGLPDGDGCDLLRRLRADGPVPAVALTAYGANEDVERGFAAGFSDYLIKPCGLEHLFRTLWAVLVRSRIASAAESPADERTDAGSGVALETASG